MYLSVTVDSVFDHPAGTGECIKQVMPLFYTFDLVSQHFGYYMYIIRLKTHKVESSCDRSASIYRLILRSYNGRNIISLLLGPRHSKTCSF